jgi:hypothetical protein
VNVTSEPIGFQADEIDTAAATRSARLKWVIVIDTELAPGRAVNAAVCVAAATATRVTGLLGPAYPDADGGIHPGLPWAGCSILGAPADQLTDLYTRALASDGVFVADMPIEGQLTRVYDELIAQVGEQSADKVRAVALSLVGPRNRIDRLVKKLALLP